MRALSLFVAAVLGQTSAQAADLSRTPNLTLDGAREVIAAAVAHARAKQAPGGAIAVVDASGTLVSLERLDGTFPAAPNISIGKARTAALFRKPTREFEALVNGGRVTMTTLPEVTPFTPLQGGVPIVVDGSVVGAVGVSGAASAQQDDEIAQAAADSFAKRRSAHAAPVLHVPRAEVDAGYRKDLNLVTDANYRVNASRRDGPGEAEVHLAETDIFYVQQGSATFVTGGRMVEPRSVSTTELRGRAIEGGEARELRAGDVITIPYGVPHWFKRVDAPFTYYVVKSTATP